MHSFVRGFNPKTIIEVGAGNSTYVIANAVVRNSCDSTMAEVIAIDPYPTPVLRQGFPGLGRVIESRVQDTDVRLFESLGPNDILSIDSSHVVRTGGDVNFLYLEILPRLRPGVIVHVHDIFLPFEYPRQWVRQRYFWNEQYLLQALLINNSEFEVLWGQKYAEWSFPEAYESVFLGRTSEPENHGSYSFWIRRRMHDQEAASHAPAGEAMA
jgi:hypothetical protein